MKKRLLSILAMASVTLCMQAKVGDDITSKYLKNADFTADAVMDNGICTYGKDMGANGTVYFGMQPITGWTASNPTTNEFVADNGELDGRASGIFAVGKQTVDEITGNEDDFEKQLFLGGKGYFAPVITSDGSAEGKVFGLVSVWGLAAKYSQEVTFPAGAYTIQMPIYNGNSGNTAAISASYFGFIAEDGTSYVVADGTWVEGEWVTAEVSFILKEETKGAICLGYNGPGGSSAMPHLFVDYVKILEADPAPIIKAEVDALKEAELLPLIEEGEKVGASVSASKAVYDDPNATMEQVLKAIEDQKKLNESSVTDLTDFFLNNAHFAQGTPLDAGVCTYDYDMVKNATKYYGMQPIPYWIGNAPSKVDAEGNNVEEGVNNARAAGLFAVGSPAEVWLGSKGDVAPATKADGSTEGNVFGFISVWSAESYYYQNVTLPAGSYTIHIPTYNERGTVAVAKNQCGFVAEDGTEYLATTTTFPVGVWKTEVIEFELDEETSGQIRIGYTAANKGSADMPHLFIDEFTITYNGLLDIKPSLLALQGAVRAGDAIESEGYEAALYTELESALQKGQALVDAKSEDDDKNTAAATEINTLIGQIRTSQAAYVKLEALVESMFADSEKFIENEDLSTLGEQIDKLAAEYDDGFKAGAYSATEIEKMMADYKSLVSEGIKTALDAAVAAGGEHNIDITMLFPDKNLDYANSNVNGWANETGTSAFLSRVQTAEVWNQAAFNVHQTLENLPAGVYEISMNGYYRTAANADNYPAWLNEEVNGKAYLYAGLNQVLMHNVAEYAVSEDDGHHSADVDGMRFSNSNDDAHYAFYEQNEAVNTVTTALVEAGDLTIGVKAVDLEDNAWVVWGAFTVTYKGTVGTEDALNEQIKNLQADALTLYDNEFVNLVNKAGDDLGTAISAGDEALDAGVDAKTAAIKGLEDAIAYASKCEATLQKWMDTRTTFENIMSNTEIESSDEKLNVLLQQDPEDGAETLEEVEKIIAEFPEAWSAYVCGQDGMESATEDEPVDVTEAILNNSFEGVTNEDAHGEFWTATAGSFGYQFGIYENYNGATFDINQTLVNMTPGYYKVRVQGMYRAGTNQTNADTYGQDSTQNVMLYANGYEKAICNQLDNGLNGEKLGVGDEPTITYGENTAYAVPNNREALQAYFEQDLYWNEVVCEVGEDGILKLGLRKNIHIETDWAPFDNFQLFYLGATTPTAVESIAVESLPVKGGIYDLTGRQVSKAVKGLYIINGKKVIK